jgi:hypothetical protein
MMTSRLHEGELYRQALYRTRVSLRYRREAAVPFGIGRGPLALQWAEPGSG